ncbi:hypothetical protein GOODEAATRI_014920 [Goodea atripinnis]|uniref:Uncharacterized protein n=1 Tax=Goodea atripinnis TaxID=208336 RepID=A0ABV0NUL2_9TELE
MTHSETGENVLLLIACVRENVLESASVLLTVKDVLVKTGLRDRAHVFLGPFSCHSSLEARWCRHSGSPGPEPGPPKLLLDLKGGLLQELESDVTLWDMSLQINAFNQNEQDCVVAKVPCSLEYWDELQQAFVLYREFSLSESCACQLQLPSLSLTEQQKELVASDLWRIVLNHNGEGGDEQR